MKRSYLNRSRRPIKRSTYLSPIGKGRVRIFKYNKYSNDSSWCNQGHLHDSKGEARYCETLDLLKKAGEIRNYKTQQMFALTVNGKRVTGHIVDFLVMTKKGKLEVHEVKGFPTDLWKVKMNLFEALYPDIEYIVIRI